MFFDDDYCLCGNSDYCPRRIECKRAEHKIGIHTYSLFYKKGEDCEYFFKKEENNEKS